MHRSDWPLQHRKIVNRRFKYEVQRLKNGWVRSKQGDQPVSSSTMTAELHRHRTRIRTRLGKRSPNPNSTTRATRSVPCC